MDVPTFTVLELTTGVRRLLREAVPSEVWVQGEIASLRRTAAGHVFFDLIEPGPEGGPPAALVGVVLFDRARREVNASLRAAGSGAPLVRMSDGVAVRLCGELDLWPGSGRLQVRMSAIDPAFTLGRLAADRDALLARLAADGTIGRNAARPLPVAPTRVGLVTRVGSAAHADALHELTSAGLGFHVLVADVGVQGPAAADELAAGVGQLVAAGAEVVLVVRGGGARTDLAAFDAEVLARAIAASSVPVVTGIGHEVDRTVADAVAHTAAKTPTAAAAVVVARRREAAARLAAAATALDRVGSDAVGRAARRHRHDRQRLERLAHAQLARAAATVDERGRRLVRVAPRQLAGADRRVAASAARAAALDPARLLARGWSITRRADGTLVRGPRDVHPGSVLATTTQGGVIASRVDGGARVPGAGPPASEIDP